MMKLLIGLLLVGLTWGCEPHCSSCNSLYCTACGVGYQLTIQGGCTPQTIPNCAIYINASICKDCQPTFLLSDNNTCEKDYSACTQKDLFELTCSECMFGKVLIDKVCRGNINCRLPQANCTECLAGFRLEGEICVDESADCLLADPTTGVCAMCKDGYVLSGYLCVASPTPPNCYISGNQGECYSCKHGFQLTPSKQCVLLKNDVCAEFDSQGRCQSCLLPSLRLENGICVDPKCAQGVEGQCTTCINGFKVKNGWICELDDVNCLVVSSNADRCDSCKAGYLVNVNGTCSIMPSNCIAANIVSLTCIQCSTGYLLKTDGKCQAPIRIANCISINQQTQICNLCANGYYIQGKICAKVSALCSGYDVKSGLCLRCISGYTYYGGQCVDTNCQKRVGDFCQICKGALLVDAKTGLCIYSDKNCAISSFSGCNACNSGYYWNYMRCVINPAYCDTANNDGACIICMPKYELTKGYCVVPIANCLDYAVNNLNSSCIACQFNFQLRNGSCQSVAPLKDIFCIQFSGSNCINCSSRYYVSNGRCVPVNPNCKTYSMNTGDCIDCYAGYQIYIGSCITSKTGDNNCKTYNNGVCVACYSNFFLNNATGLCLGISPLCQTSNNITGACLSCYKGYSLSGGECLLAYLDANCIRFDAKGQCVACSSRFFMKNGLCSPISPLCRTYNTTTGDCLGCYPGYFLSSGSCLSGADPTTDLNCKLKDTNLRCLQCYPNYYLHQNGTCILANPLCKSINNTNGDCTSCYPGYLIKGATCGVPSATDADPNCLTFYEPNNCSQCYASYYLSNGLCHKINLLCKTYNTTNGYCLSCYPGYALNLEGLCVIPQAEAYVARDPYCAKFNGFNCIQCAPGFYVGSGTCTAVSPLCKSYNAFTGICTECYSGYSLQNGICVVIQQIQISYCQVRQGSNCQKCMQGYYTQSPQLCSPVSILCGNYDQNTGACLSCISGYFLQGGSCVFPSMGFDANCIGYDASAYCSMCKPGYYLYNYICALIDPNCYNFDSMQGICLACGNGKQPSGAKCA